MLEPYREVCWDHTQRCIATIERGFVGTLQSGVLGPYREGVLGL